MQNSSVHGAFNQVPSYSAEPLTKSPRNSNLDAKTERMFKSTAWRDLWAAILYYVHLAGVVIILGLNFSNLSKLESVRGDESIKMVQTLGIVGISALAAVAFVVTFLMLLNRFPNTMIKSTFISSIIILALMGVGMFFVPNGQFMGLIYLVLAGLNVVIYFSWRKRIPFSASLLKCVVDVMKIYPSTWNLSTFAVLGQGLFSLFYLTTIAAIGLKYSDAARNSDPVQIAKGDLAALFYIIFSMYWSMQVIENIVHTSICGVFGTFYFLHGSGAAIIKPVWGSFSRAMTYSFGSIAFGSLIVAVIQFIRFLINSTRNDRDNIAAACADCLIGLIEGAVRYFNYYAYVHVAIYGKPFIESGKDTWNLIKSHGVDVIINDSLVGNCMSVAVFLIGLTCGLIAFIIGTFVLENKYLAFTAAGISFFLAAVITAVATQLIESGVSATLVCYAEDPNALQRTKPELYREITGSYQQSFL